MEQMYQDYKDIAAFRMVYINEAHAADSRWAVGYAKELNITEHDDYAERCTTAEMLLKDKSLTIPCLIDEMDNKVNEAYRAWPDRIFLVRTDGRLAVAAKRGPWGFKPALDEAKAWLDEFERTGVEPALAEKPAEPARDGASSSEAAGPGLAPLLGEWAMETDLQGQIIEATMTLAVQGGALSGTWSSMGREMTLENLRFEDGSLTFMRRVNEQMEVAFRGAVEGDTIDGAYETDFGSIPSTGRRVGRATVHVDDLLGSWTMRMQMMGDAAGQAVLTVSQVDGALTASWTMRDRAIEMENVTFEDGVLRFTRPGRRATQFEATIENGVLKGTLSSGDRKREVTGEKNKS